MQNLVNVEVFLVVLVEEHHKVLGMANDCLQCAIAPFRVAQLERQFLELNGTMDHSKKPFP